MILPEITFWGCIFFSLLMLTVPLPWAAAALAAGAFHECCHALTICALGGRIHRFSLGSFGANIQISGLSRGGELAAAAAGPAGSFLLLFGLSAFPRLAVCGLIQGAFNLLPIYPMDGGRILYSFLGFFLPEERARRITKITGGTVLCVLVSFLLGQAEIPGVLLSGFLLFRIFHVKFPCKDRISRVQ